MNQFQDAKTEIGAGWHNLIDTLQDYVLSNQQHRLKTNDGKFQKSDKPVFEFIIDQCKSKLGGLRIYAHLEEVNHNWEVFDQDHYNLRFNETSFMINGFISALESLSYTISEISGDKGSLRNLGGFLQTLSEKEYRESLDKPRF